MESLTTPEDVMSLHERIVSRSAQVGIIGLGYVGLTEAVEFAKAGFRVTGFDIDAKRARDVQAGRSHLVDLPDAELSQVVGSGALQATDSLSALGSMDAILICVPTPLGKTKAPDLSYIVNATDAIRGYLRPGQLVVLESTTYPGTTSEVVLPALESTGLRAGSDFHLCFSPERINPGDREHPPSRIPRVLGGVTRRCAELAAKLYAGVSADVLTVSSPRAAEMVKLLENTFRAVNIGLVNELALMCRALDIDVWEIIDAAATKPFGFMPFYPGPGLGGHCIPIDPLYLSWKARISGFEPRFIDLAHQVNSCMPLKVVSMIGEAVNDRGRSLKGSSVLILGVSYKRNVNDTRESPAIEIIAELRKRGAAVAYHDSHVPALDVAGYRMSSVRLDDELVGTADCVVIVTDHSDVDYKRVVELAPVVIDTRNATRNIVQGRERIVKL